MSLHGMMGYAPRFTAPRCQTSVIAPESLEGLPSANAKVYVLSIYLPTSGDGWLTATRHDNACLLSSRTLDYHCQCPPKSLIKNQETGETVTHSLLVLLVLLVTTVAPASKDERPQPG